VGAPIGAPRKPFELAVGKRIAKVCRFGYVSGQEHPETIGKLKDDPPVAECRHRNSDGMWGRRRVARRRAISGLTDRFLAVGTPIILAGNARTPGLRSLLFWP
jgi:hypothetical protein